MKILHILILVVSFFGFNLSIKAQDCIVLLFTVNLNDENGEVIENGQFEFFDPDHNIYTRWDNEKKVYQGRLGLCASFDHRKRVPLRISAEGFETVEKEIDLSKSERNFTINLKRKETLIINDSKNQAILSGTVYDANGAVIPQTIVIAINERGEKFATLANSEGIYVLNLPFNRYNSKSSAGFKVAKYAISAEQKHFDKFVLKDFKFVPSTNGKMNLDIALDVDTSNCGVAGCLPNLQSVESQKRMVSDKILQIPLEKIPKE